MGKEDFAEYEYVAQPGPRALVKAVSTEYFYKI